MDHEYNSSGVCKFCGIDGASTDPCHERPTGGDGYEVLRAILAEAVLQSSGGKGKERHANPGETFQDQQIVKLGLWLKNNGFQIGQACKKSIESTRLPYERARAELLGAIVYTAAAIKVLDELQAMAPPVVVPIAGLADLIAPQPTDEDPVGRRGSEIVESRCLWCKRDDVDLAWYAVGCFFRCIDRAACADHAEGVAGKRNCLACNGKGKRFRGELYATICHNCNGTGRA